MRGSRQEYEYWLKYEGLDEDTKRELQSIAGNDAEIEGRFKSMMNFGTAGLRGIMQAGTAMMNVYTVRYATQALANVILRNGGGSVAIAYDCRNNSELFAKESARVLAANGIKTYLFDELRPTPELSFAVRETGSIAGINITASHNTKEYNGYKVYWSDGAQIGNEKASEIAKEIEKIDIFCDVKIADFDGAKSDGLIEIIGSEIDKKYLEKVQEQSIGKEYIEKAGDKVSIVYTPFHGAGYKLAPEILKRIGIKNLTTVDEQMVIDGNFPTMKSPNPENAEGFDLAIKYAKKVDADLIIATDPDSDRCGAMVKNGEEYIKLSGNQMACLMLDYIISVKQEAGAMPKNPTVCKSIVSTLMVDKICKDNDVELVKVLTGFKYIGEKIREFEESGNRDFLFGFEESLGFLTGTYTRDKDAVIASMLLAEIACYYKSKGKSVYEGLQELHEKYGYFEEVNKSIWYEGYDAFEKMNEVMKGIRENGLFDGNLKSDNQSALNVVGVKDYLGGITGFDKSNVISYELADGSLITIRPSGTEPRIKVYMMAQGASHSEARARLETIGSKLDSLFSK